MTEDNRIPKIRAVLDEISREKTGDGFYFASKLAQVKSILDSAPPAPRVFFPGDTVPAGTWVMTERATETRVLVGHPERGWKVMFGPCVEVRDLPSSEEWQAAVDRARDARVGELRAAMIEADRNYQPPPGPAPGADRWASARNTCPHGIVRGLITCPQCEPEKQAAAEAHARAAVVEQPDEGGEYRCSNCGTRGWDCLYAMNCSPTERRCCRECGINQTHTRPGASEERAIPEPTEGHES